MRKLLLYGAWFLAVSCWVGCSSDLSPEQAAAEAAQSYYQRLLDGYADGLLAAKAGVESLSGDYRAQLRKAYEQYVEDIKVKHGGLRSVAVSANVGRTDTVQHLTYAFLILSFNDSTQEEITVPMVEVDGEWRIK